MANADSTTYQWDPSDVVITIEAGADPATAFHVHHTVLCKSSRLFQQQLRGALLNLNDVVRLPAVSADNFRLYSKWLYTGQLDLPSAERLNFEHAEDYCWILAGSYVLAEHVQDDDYRDEISNKFVDILTIGVTSKVFHSFSTEITAYVYQNTAPNSTLRRILVDRYASLGVNSLEVLNGKLPHDCVYDIMLSLARHASRTGLMPTGVKEDRCEYHSHAIDVDHVASESCPRTQRQ